MDEISPEEERIQCLSQKVSAHLEGRSVSEEEREELLNLVSVCQEGVTSLLSAKQKLRESELDAYCIKEELAASVHADKIFEKSKSQLSDEISALAAQFNTLERSERRKREKIIALSTENNKLISVIEEGSGWRPEQKREREKLLTAISIVTQEVEDTDMALKERRNCNQQLEEKFNAAERKRDEIQVGNDLLAKRLLQCSNELGAETRKRHELSSNLDDLQEEIQRRQNELIQKQKVLEGEKKETDIVELHLEQAKCNMEDHLRQYKDFLRNTQGLTKDLQGQIECNNKLELENNKNDDILAGKKKDLMIVHKELEQANKLNGLFRHKIEEVEKHRVQYQEQSDRIKFATDKIERADLSGANKEYELQARQIENLKHELDIIEKKTLKSDKSVSRVHDLIAVNEIILHNLHVEEAHLAKTIESHQSSIETILKERKCCSIEKRDVRSKLESTVSKLHDQEKRAVSLKRIIIDAERNLSQQEKMYESIRHENDALSRHLLQVRNSTLEERRNFKNARRKLAQVKDDIMSSDDFLIKEHFFHFHIDRDRGALDTKLGKVKKQIIDTYKTQCLQEAEIQRLQTIIYEAEHERKRLITNIRNTVSEHVMLESKSTQQREEIKRLYDQASHLKTSLRLSEAQYQEKIRDIELATNELQRTRDEYSELEAQLAEREDNNQNLTALERNLSRTKLKNKALSDELDRPLNIHRYRDLESRDTQAFEKLKRVHYLQKRLIATSDSLSEKSLTLEDKEKFYHELGCLAQRTLGERKIQSQLDAYVLCYRDKSKQLKRLHEDLEVQKMSVERLRKHIVEIEQKKKVLVTEWMRCAFASSGIASGIEAASFDPQQ
eukprot:CAMPEP_0116024268 /NCGR_PEP_ID=MMETSP0321-20121206/12205_1 /TAXON_ID=163516 /ORGANISM="Leptocylindrus danicus var. danicus, Strain B650" /LENGTH=843 /DNA_ID=CAMNT_0003495945 /DNA_START=463 /DNA_END=2994 /DNA_ORIENTATION=-